MVFDDVKYSVGVRAPTIRNNAGLESRMHFNGAAWKLSEQFVISRQVSVEPFQRSPLVFSSLGIFQAPYFLNPILAGEIKYMIFVALDFSGS